MATILWKDGKSVRVEAERVQSMLSAGYTVTNEIENESVITQKQDMNILIPKTDLEYRHEARDKGVKNWRTAKIFALKEVLGYA